MMGHPLTITDVSFRLECISQCARFILNDTLSPASASLSHLASSYIAEYRRLTFPPRRRTRK